MSEKRHDSRGTRLRGANEAKRSASGGWRGFCKGERPTQPAANLRGSEHPDVASALCNLGEFPQNQGKLAEPENLDRQALAMALRISFGLRGSCQQF